MGNTIGTRLLAHLGSVAGYVDKLGLVGFLDARACKRKRAPRFFRTSGQGHHQSL